MALQSFKKHGIIYASDINERTFQNVQRGEKIKPQHSTTIPKQLKGTTIDISDFPIPYQFLDLSQNSGWNNFGGCQYEGAMWDDNYANTWAPSASTWDGTYRTFQLHGSVSKIPNGHHTRNKIDLTNVESIIITYKTSDPVLHYRFTLFSDPIVFGPGGDDTDKYQISCFWQSNDNVKILFQNDDSGTPAVVTNDTTIEISLGERLNESRYFCIAGDAWGNSNYYIYIKEIKLKLLSS